MKSKQQVQPAGNFPVGLSQPAQRALAEAGYTKLEQLAEISEAEFKQLHGIGPKAIELLRQTLAAKGLAFADK